MSHNNPKLFKAPPATTTNLLLSQELRRNKALAEQKRKRAQKVDLCRQLDLFAGLNLGPSDDEDDVILSGHNSVPLPQTKVVEISSEEVATNEPPQRQSYRKGRGKHRYRQASETSHRPTKWAGRCMYAELLEMKDVEEWSMSMDGTIDDGLPSDLENGYVAVAPVPTGKRCLAVTYQTCGSTGTAPNTALRSRVQGKSLMPPFPSPLPPSTILDCILDVGWRDNGILHVLDIIQYKGQNVGDCETAFRFWWRDTRLAELPRFPPPSESYRPLMKTGNSSDGVLFPSTHPALPTSVAEPNHYRFSYPNTLLPVPYHTDTTLRHLSSHVIPLSRSSRSVTVEIPGPLCDVPSDLAASWMDTDIDLFSSQRSTTPLVPTTVNIDADGLLLYVAEASYEPGTSPLSSWVPITGHEPYLNRALDLFERLVYQCIRRTRHDEPGITDMDVEAREVNPGS